MGLRRYAKRAGRKVRSGVKSAGRKVTGYAKRAGTAFYGALANPAVQGVLTAVVPVLGAAAAAVTAHRAKGDMDDFEDEAAGLRGEAAKRLVNTQRQAGGGQIRFNTEEYE